MESQPPVHSNQPVSEDSIFENSYYNEVQKDIWLHERKKTAISLMTIGAILLIGDLLGLYISNALTTLTFLFLLVIPAIYFGLAYIARFKPMLAVVLGGCLFGLLLIYNIYLLGGRGIFNGWLIKAAVIFFIFKSFRHAKDAEEARKNLAIFH